MSAEIANKWTERESVLLEVAEDVTCEARAYEGYSGRYMYGREVNAVTVDRWSVDEVIEEMQSRGYEAPSVDNLGLDMILYYTDKDE